MDIDIDFADNEEAKDLFKDKVTFALHIDNGKIRKHTVGVYFQTIPKDKITGWSAIPCKISTDEKKIDYAEELGYNKIDFLELKLLKRLKSKAELHQLIRLEPDWELLQDKEFVSKLFHIRDHFDVVSRVNPRSILELADVLALIRPGKIKLLDKYLRDPEGIRPELYTKRHPMDMRKSHCIPYAMLIVVNMHLNKRDMET
jgi:hypothetical protein